MEFENYIGIMNLIVTALIGVISWFVSAYLTKKTIQKKQISYEIKMFPIISKNYLSKTSELSVSYKNEILPEPTLLAVDIINSGNSSIENPPIVVEATGATYVRPGYIEDFPPGYDKIWELERLDAESCEIKIGHINPGQVVKARFFLDEMPDELPMFKCPMKDLVVRQVNTELKEVVLATFIDALKISVNKI